MSDLRSIKLALPSFLFDSVFPTIDSVLDLVLILRWYTTGHANYATGLAVPFIINLCFNTYQWWKWDSKSEKKLTWMLLVLQVWPIYRSAKFILYLSKRKHEAEKEKRKFVKRIDFLEPYLESVPSLFVLFIALFASGSVPGIALNQLENYDSLIGDSVILFWMKFGIAMVTSTLGLSTYLLKGPCRVVPNRGYLNGILSWKYLVACIGTIFTLGGKLAIAAYLFLLPFSIHHSLDPTKELIYDANHTSESIYDTSVFDNLYSNDTEKEAFVREIYKREVVEMSSEEMLKSKLYNTEMMMSKYNYSVYGFNYDDVEHGTITNHDYANDEYSDSSEEDLAIIEIASAHIFNTTEENLRNPKSLYNINDEDTTVSNIPTAQNLNATQGNLEVFNLSVFTKNHSNNNLGNIYFQNLVIVFGFMILPQFLMAISAFLYVTVSRKMISNLIWNNPQMWLIPVFTYFTFGPTISTSFKETQNAKMSTKLAFSRLLTICNMILTFVCFVLATLMLGNLRHSSDFSLMLLHQAVEIYMIISIPGLILTIIFLGSCTCHCTLDSHQMDINNMNESIEAIKSISGQNRRESIFLKNTDENGNDLRKAYRANNTPLFEFSRRQTL